MGLLDGLQSDQGLLGLSLLAAAAPRAGGRTGFGEGLLGAVMAMQQRTTAEEDRRMRQQQMEMQRQQQALQLQQMQRQVQQQDTDANALRGLFQPLPGPTQDGSQLRKGFDPAGMLQAGASPQALQQALQLDQLVNPRAKPPQYKVVNGSLVRIGGDDTVTEAYRAPEKPTEEPAAVREYLFAKTQQGYRGTFEEWKKSNARAGASTTSVSYGTPVAAIDAQGNPVYIQPAKDGGPPSVIQGMRPPKSGIEERAEQEKLTRERTAKQMLSVLADAEAILSGGKATASGVGNLRDAGARMLGVTTDNAQGAARLEAMSGWLVSNVPRMEGPQSNFDMQNYISMAGKVGDRTVPIPERLAALKEVRKLQGKYAAINGTPIEPEPQQGGFQDADKERRYQEWKRRQGGGQ